QFLARAPGAIFERSPLIDDDRERDTAPGRDRPIDQRPRVELGAKRPISPENAGPVGEQDADLFFDAPAPRPPVGGRQRLAQRNQPLALSAAPALYLI